MITTGKKFLVYFNDEANKEEIAIEVEGDTVLIHKGDDVVASVTNGTITGDASQALIAIAYAAKIWGQTVDAGNFSIEDVEPVPDAPIHLTRRTQ